MTETRTTPPPLRKGGGAVSTAATGSSVAENSFSVLSGRKTGAQRIVLYGPGGVGKSTLAALAPEPVFLDIEGGTRELDVPRVEGIESFADLRAALQSGTLEGYKTVVLDSATRAEEWSIAHTVKTVPHEKGHSVTSLEGYGFGRGLQHNYDTFLRLLQDLDGQVRRGRNVILICHDCTADVPNPVGDDYIRFEPHLQAPKSGKASIRNRVVQWADHVLFIGYDIIGKEGKGRGTGTRTIWTFELPDHIAKSRMLREALPFQSIDDSTIWKLIFEGGVR